MHRIRWWSSSTRLKSLIEEERQKAGRGSPDMKVQSFNREEDLKTLLLTEITDRGTMKCSWTGWDIHIIRLSPTGQAVFWWTTKG
ncbi:MAG: hypothetical protein ACLR0U_17915 [Enterocloster clostridioformis]